MYEHILFKNAIPVEQWAWFSGLQIFCEPPYIFLSIVGSLRGKENMLFIWCLNAKINIVVCKIICEDFHNFSGISEETY